MLVQFRAQSPEELGPVVGKSLPMCPVQVAGHGKETALPMAEAGALQALLACHTPAMANSNTEVQLKVRSMSKSQRPTWCGLTVCSPPFEKCANLHCGMQTSHKYTLRSSCQHELDGSTEAGACMTMVCAQVKAA